MSAQDDALRLLAAALRAPLSATVRLSVQSTLQCLHAELARRSGDLGSRAGGWFGRGQQEEAERVLELAWLLARLHAASFVPLPAGFWLSCHRLVTGQRKLPAPYRRLLLLGMTASNRLDGVRLAQLFALIEEEWPALRLLPVQAGDGPGYGLSCDVDAPPRYAEAGAGMLKVDGATLLAALQRRRQRLWQQGDTGLAELPLISRLEQDWSAPARRRHRRRRRGGDSVELVCGLAACRASLAGQAPEESLRLEVCNVSVSGLQLQGRAPQLYPGEVVLLRRGARRWLGLVRWMSFGVDDCACGVELLGHSPQAVELWAETSHGAGESSAALRLPPDSRRGRAGILLVAGRPYQALRPFRLSGPDGEQRVSLTRLLQQGAAYQCVELRVDEVF